MRNEESNSKESNKEERLLKFKKELSEFFLKARLELGYKTKDDFSDAKNIVRSQYSHYESGKANPTIETVFNLLNDLGLDYTDLFKLPVNSEKDCKEFDHDLLFEFIKEQVLEQVKRLKGNEFASKFSSINTIRILKTLTFCIKPKSKKEILGNLGLKNTTNNFKRTISIALELNWLQMTDPISPNNPHQKYYTSEKGKKII
ncbi:Helix-turn-helix protein [Belliella baltica DSM 15883]|uniref:Helix-turn-helix protein n=1 Tax=Belliella baltica (strain DSM 15883 / CIP 108006 / LMG 21964 / BA134) TaxID=866536 RepID=I3Z2Y5_BELBD|nr:helix-turn-helix transcriptional regulator [Belliella baltica]AFL83603.1 Helix-turn-helix protein [Belliella baltica DSM 15883]